MAVWIILLTVLPFTAPFSTWDTAELTGEASALDKRTCSKSADDSIDGCALVSVFLPLALVGSLVHTPTADPAADRSALLIVLRL